MANSWTSYGWCTTYFSNVVFRLEHINYIENKNEANCSLEITAYENMGNEQLVYFYLQQKPLIVRGQSKEEVEFGQIKKLFFSKDKIIFIDPNNGEVINNLF